MDVHTVDSGSEGESYTTARVCWWPKKLFLETSNGWQKGLVSTQTQRPELRSQHTCKRLSVVLGSYDTGCVGNLGATAKSISSKFTESLSQKIRCRAKEGSMQYEDLAFMCVHMHVCTYPYKQVDTHKICVYSTHSHIYRRETERWETETQREAENRDTQRYFHDELGPMLNIVEQARKAHKCWNMCSSKRVQNLHGVLLTRWDLRKKHKKGKGQEKKVNSVKWKLTSALPSESHLPPSAQT